jgi:hypothetical protein
LFGIASAFSKIAPEAASLVKLKLFSKLFGETWAYGRNSTKLRFPASPTQCKMKTASPVASWMKLLKKYLFSTASCEAIFKTLQKTVPKEL